MSRWLLMVSVVFTLGASGFLAYSIQTSSLGPQSENSATVSIRRVSPIVKSGETDVVCKASESVEFTYEVTNETSQTIRGLHPRLTCRCQILKELPKVLEPGESGQVSFKLRGPTAGRMPWNIVLEIDGVTDPVGVLQPCLVVPITTPSITFFPKRIDLNAVAGKPLERSFVIETIERAKTEPWLEELRIQVPDLTVEQTIDVDERYQTDPTLVYRTYTFQLKLPAQEACEHLSIAALTARGNPSKTLDHIIPFRLKVSPRIDVLPHKIVFRENGKQDKRLMIIRRDDESEISFPKHQSDLVQVVPVLNDTGRLIAFDVSLIGGSTTTILEPLKFVVNGSHQLQVDLLVAGNQKQ